MGHIIFTIAASLILLALGVFFIVKGARSRPYKLKKSPICITFRQNMPHELREPLATIHSTKTELFGTAIWLCILAVVVCLLINGYGEFFYLVPCCIGVFYTLWLSTRKLLLYANAVVVRSITGRKVYYLDEITSLESYNVVNSFNKGVSYGYALYKGKDAVVSFPKGSYKDIDRIEEVYRGNVYMEDFVETEYNA